MSYKDRFKDQIALVTGASSGIGKAIANRILSEGGIVYGVDSNYAGLLELQKEFETHKEQLHIKTLDVTNEEEVAKVCDEIAAQYNKLDITVNSAGIVGPTAKKILEYETASYHKVIDVNLNGSYHLMKHSVRVMEPNNYGRILMLASIAGKEGNPGMVGYTVSKAGVIGLVKGIAKEYADTGITVNGLAPAVIATPMNLKTSQEQLDYMTQKIPMGRLGKPEEVTSLACWIVSKESSFNTGVIFDLSGGRATY